MTSSDNDASNLRGGRICIDAFLFCDLKLTAPKPLPAAYPKTLTTIGCHIRKRRLDLGLTQLEVAPQLGVTEKTVNTWEVHGTQPGIRFIPNIVAFLGYNPLPPARTLAERIRRCRKSLGLSIVELARQLKIDYSTLGAWELGRVKKPWPACVAFFQEWVARGEAGRGE